MCECACATAPGRGARRGAADAAAFVCLLLLVLAGEARPADGKVYERCELARELMYRHSMPRAQISTWVCIARYESEFNSSAVGHAGGDGSGDHGIFQISDLYWCSPPGRGRACGMNCAQLVDDDISDDVACVKKIYNEHQGLSGDGFNAWAVYRPYCRQPAHMMSEFVAGCFASEVQPALSSNELGDGNAVAAVHKPPPPPPAAPERRGAAQRYTYNSNSPALSVRYQYNQYSYYNPAVQRTPAPAPQRRFGFGAPQFSFNSPQRFFFGATPPLPSPPVRRTAARPYQTRAPAFWYG